MDNVIDITSRIKETNKKLRDTVYNRYKMCIETMNVSQSFCKCEYCNYISSKGDLISKLVLEKLKRDAKKNNLVFSSNDARMILVESIKRVTSKMPTIISNKGVIVDE